MYCNGIQSYRKTSVITSDPGKLVLMCYEGAIVQLKIAKQTYNDKEYESKAKALKKAMGFIDELLYGLDFEKGGTISQNLAGLYDYMNRRIIQADADRNPDAFDEVIGILTELMSAWKEILAGQNKRVNPESIGFKTGRAQQPQNHIGI